MRAADVHHGADLAESLTPITWALGSLPRAIAAAYWIVVLFPLIRALVEMG